MDINRIPGETDKKGHGTENILPREGFMKALSTALCLRPNGLLRMAPVCSSFVFMNSSDCKRTKQNPAGNTGYGPVRDGNSLQSHRNFHKCKVFGITLAAALAMKGHFSFRLRRSNETLRCDDSLIG